MTSFHVGLLIGYIAGSLSVFFLLALLNMAKDNIHEEPIFKAKSGMYDPMDPTDGAQ